MNTFRLLSTRAASMTVSTGFWHSQIGNPARSGTFYGLLLVLGGFLTTLIVLMVKM